MTKQEVKEEFKQNEGDPQVKSQRKAKYQAMVRNAISQVKDATVVITNAMWIWNDYLLPFLIIGNNDSKTLTLSLYYAKSLSGQYGNPWELIFPAVLICVIPILIVFIFLQKNIIEGIAAGAVKG